MLNWILAPAKRSVTDTNVRSTYNLLKWNEIMRLRSSGFRVAQGQNNEQTDLQTKKTKMPRIVTINLFCFH